jgi:hypothetical protein
LVAEWALAWLLEVNLADLDRESWHRQFRAELHDYRGRLVRHAEECSTTPREFATTLLVGAATVSRAVVAQLGDGAVALRLDGTWRAPTPPPESEYVNETWFVTDGPEVIDRCSTAEVLDGAIDALIAIPFKIGTPRNQVGFGGRC